MPLTDRERNVLNGIYEWEKGLLQHQSNDLLMTYEKYLEKSFELVPEKIQKQFFSIVDSWLYHLHAIIQGSKIQTEARDRVLSSGRIFSDNIGTIPDLKTLRLDQLQYIAQQQIARHRFYSFAQGGITGTGGLIQLGSDIPAMAIINLRSVQLIAMTYGFEINTPYEMMISLKVFHTATLPLRYQKDGWITLVNEMENDDHYFYEGNEEIMDTTWLEPLTYQLLKAMVILYFRKRMFQGIPLISMGLGAGLNYQFSKKVTEFAHNYYQLRFLKSKEENLL